MEESGSTRTWKSTIRTSSTKQNRERNKVRVDKKKRKINWLNSVNTKHANFIDNCTGGK